jgi:hypothetical protein
LGKRLHLCSALLGLLLASGLLQSGMAQTGELSVASSVDKASITIGDPIHFTLTVDQAPGIKVNLPGLNVALGNFEIRDYKSHQQVHKQTGRTALTIAYVITTYGTGQYAIPPVTLEYVTPANERKTVSSDSIQIEVRSIKPSEAQEIKDIRTPVEIPASLGWLYWSLAILGLALAGLGGYYVYLRKRWMGRGFIFDREAELLRPPHEVAHEELDRIEHMGLIAAGRIKEHYTLAADALRTYTARRYGIVTLERTTDEIIQEMSDRSLPADHVVRYRDFYLACDMVKFAKHVPDAGEINSLVPTARAIVDATRELAAPSITGAPAMGGNA